jgi:hypothetical protein
MANVQSLYELRAVREAERSSQLREQRQMTLERRKAVCRTVPPWLALSHSCALILHLQLLSSLPPLYQPVPVQLVKANRHTVWVKWPT